MATGVTDDARAVRSDDADDPARAATLRESSSPRDGFGSSPGLRVLAGVRLLLAALWLGGAVFFSFVVAPTVFQVLPTRELAGAVVTRTIAVVNVGGFVVGLALLASAFDIGAATRRRLARAVEIASLAVLTLACGVGHWVVSARMLALRAQMGQPIDRVPLDHPARVAFDDLHHYSVALMCVAIVAGTVALFAVARRRN